MTLNVKRKFLAIYVRVSTVLQVDNTSLDEQVSLCEKRALELGYLKDSFRIYREEGATGEDIDVRPVMTRLREDVAEGIISHVVCTHPDRFSRDLTDKLIVVRELEKNGADLSFTDTEFEKSPEGILFFNIISAIASYELALIKKRTVRGRERAVREKQKIMPMRVAPFGYDKDEDGQLVINTKEASYVRMIYEWYIFEQLTTREIGEKLYSAGIMPKRGESKSWSASSIGRILTSEIYIGKYYYNRRKTKKVKGKTTKSGKPQRSISYREQEEWIEVPVPAIVDEHIYALAQNQKNKNTTNKHIGNPKYQFLLKTILKCGHCGRTWDATTYSGRMDKETGERVKYRCYRCPNIVPKRYGTEVEKCPSQSLRAEILEDYIWEQIVKLVDDPSLFVEQMNKENGTGTEELEMRLLMLQAQAELCEKEKDKVKIMFRREVITEDEMVSDIGKLNDSLETLSIEINKYQMQLDNRQQSEMTLELVKGMVASIQSRLRSPETLTFDFKRHVITTLFDEIMVRFEPGPDGDTKLVVSSIGTFDKLFSQNQNPEIAASIDIGVRTQRQEI